MPQPVIDCDLSRAFLDLCALPSGQTLKIANTPDAIAAFVADLKADTLVVCGATSGCDGDLIAVARQLLVILNAMIRKSTPIAIA